jgi:hypothetical protein
MSLQGGVNVNPSIVDVAPPSPTSTVSSSSPEPGPSEIAQGEVCPDHVCSERDQAIPASAGRSVPIAELAPAIATEFGSDPGRATVSLVASKPYYEPDEEILIEVLLNRSLDLRGYQVALDASGGTTGYLLPADAQIHATRQDFVFAGLSSERTVDAARPSVTSVLPYGSVSAPTQHYLGTFAMRPSGDASGEFRLRLCMSDSTMTDSFGDPIELRASEVAVTVLPSSDLADGPGMFEALTTVVPYGSTWSYLDTVTAEVPGWTGLAFDDASWATGLAELGYGDAPATVVGCGCSVPTCTNTGCSPKNISTYFRHTFNVTDASSVLSLSLNVVRDDGIVVYLNGTEVCRDNMPGGAILFSTLASAGISGAGESTPVACPAPDPGLLVDGDNVLAAEVHQVLDTSSDISFNQRIAEPRAEGQRHRSGPRQSRRDVLRPARRPCAARGRLHDHPHRRHAVLRAGLPGHVHRDHAVDPRQPGDSQHRLRLGVRRHRQHRHCDRTVG